MTLKAIQTRSGDQEQPTDTPSKHNGSDNGYSIYLPNRIQSQSRAGLARSNTNGDDAVTVARFWGKVNKTAGCWLWTGSVAGSSTVKHGQFVSHRQRFYAHRFSWVLAYGPIPDGLQINHRCDVGRCVRPEHLFLGTQQDNLLDARQKGRLDNSAPRTRVFSLADRLAIFHMPDRRGLGMELAIRYGVSKTCISLIRRGRFIGSPTVEGVKRPFQSGGSGQHQQPRSFNGLGFALDPVPYRQLVVRGEIG